MNVCIVTKTFIHKHCLQEHIRTHIGLTTKKHLNVFFAKKLFSLKTICNTIFALIPTKKYLNVRIVTRSFSILAVCNDILAFIPTKPSDCLFFYKNFSQALCKISRTHSQNEQKSIFLIFIDFYTK